MIRYLYPLHSLFNVLVTIYFRKVLSQNTIQNKPYLRSYHVTVNPYTWFTMDSLEDSWQSLLRAVKERDLMIEKETLRQEQREELRKAYAAQGLLLASSTWLVFWFQINFSNIGSVHNSKSQCHTTRLARTISPKLIPETVFSEQVFGVVGDYETETNEQQISTWGSEGSHWEQTRGNQEEASCSPWNWGTFLFLLVRFS